MNKPFLYTFLLFSMLVSSAQGVDDVLPDKIGTGTHSSVIKSISSLLAISLRSHASADVLRYKNVTSVEYFDGTSWVNSSTESWKRVLDGVDENAWTITDNKIRFTIDLGGAWIRPSAYLIGQDWNSGERDYTLTVESSGDQTNWSTNLAPTQSGASNTALNLFMIDTQSNADRYIRLTIESLADTSNPIQLFQVSAFTKRFVGLSGSSALPFYTDFEKNIGIGTSDPKTILSIGNHSDKTLSTAGITLGSDHKSIELLHSGSVNGYGSKIYGVDEGSGITSLRFAVRGNTTNWTDAIYVKAVNNSSVGNVGIGTTTPTEKLEVNGTIRSKEVKVEAAPWPDYVFADNYELPSLEAIEKFIKSEGHLPEVPSAVEVEENGIALGKMNALLLKKIEELTLYQIEMMKELKALKEENILQQIEIEILKGN